MDLQTAQRQGLYASFQRLEEQVVPMQERCDKLNRELHDSERARARLEAELRGGGA